jgi:hypothetical protein
MFPKHDFFLCGGDRTTRILRQSPSFREDRNDPKNTIANPKAVAATKAATA